MMRIEREKGFLGFVLLIMTCFKSRFLSLMSAEKLFPRVIFSTDTLEFHNSPSLFSSETFKHILDRFSKTVSYQHLADYFTCGIGITIKEVSL